MSPIDRTAAAAPEGAPPFDRGRFWLPPFLLATAGGLALLLFATDLDSWGYAVVLGVPFAIGCALGYGVRAGKISLFLLALLAVAGLIGGAITASLAGMLCGTILAGILVGPLLVGLVLGVLLRLGLRGSRFSQRWYLPVLALFLVTGGLVYAEHRLVSRKDVETVRTARVLPADVSLAWDSLVFYEEIRHAPPMLTRIGLPHPLHTTGEITGVGDVKTCVYDTGRLVKRITRYRPGEVLEFDVVLQQGIEDRSVRLVSGSFHFEPLESGGTRVTLTTVYEPLLTARLVWRPFERRLARSLHEHVLEGIELESRRSTRMLVARGRP